MKAVVAIDIGNTRAHIALVDTDEFRCIARTDLLTKDILTDTIASIDTLFTQTKTFNCNSIVVSSVVNSTLNSLLNSFHVNNMKAKVFKYNAELPVKINYSNPYALGTDRIANAMYANRMYTDMNSILISAGTAITVDLMIGNQFEGGAILPGLQMQLKSLHNSTDALPEIDLKGDCKLPGSSTEQCIRSGILYGTAGALNHIVSQYKKQLKSSPIILATGGAWPLLQKFTDFDPLFIPDMTLLGVSLLT